MKMKFFFAFFLLFMYSCSDNLSLDLPKDNESLNENLNENNQRRKAGMDGKYDVLGYGYNATGKYMDSYSTTYPVIDMNKFALQHLSDIETDLSTSTDGTLQSGSNAETYASDLTASLKIAYKAPLFSLFSGQITSTYSTSSHTSSKYSYASYNLTLRQKRISINSSIQDLSNYLSDKFISDLNTQTAEYIVQTYGTHVLTQVELGGKLSVSYKSVTTSSDKKSAVSAGLIVNVAKVFSINANLSIKDSLASTNTEQNLIFKTSGGNVNASIVGNLVLDNTTPTPINISNWQSSCNISNAVLINVAPGKMIYIYELVTDPVKRQALERAVDNYIANNSIIVTCQLKKYSHVLTGQYLYTTQNKIGWNFSEITCNVLSPDIYKPGAIPFYQGSRKRTTFGVFNGTYDYFYSTDPGECVSKNYTIIESVCKVYNTQIDKTVPLYRYYNNTRNQYYYTTKYDVYGPSGFIFQKIACYVPE